MFRGNLAIAMFFFGLLVYSANSGAIGRFLYVIGLRDNNE